MKIKEINLQHYGPLPKFNKTFDDGVQIIYGSNESGKTLLIDAVMKLLVGGKKFHPILNRVEETPSGYVLIEKEGEEIKLDSKQSLEDLMKIGSDELRNIFCIRDADLQISDENEFYERTQDKLAGLRSSDIRRIINALRSRGKLTGSGDLSDSAGNEYVKSTYSNANTLISQISTYIQKARKDNFENLELELLREKSDQIITLEKLATLNKAKKNHEYELIKNNFDKFLDANSKFKNIPTDILNRLKTQIVEYETNPINEKEINRKLGLLKTVSQISLGLAAVTFTIAFVLSIPTAGYLIPLLFFILGGYVLTQWNQNNSLLSRAETRGTEIISTSKQLKINSNTIPEIKADLELLVKNNDTTRTILLENRGIVKNAFNIKTEITDEIVTLATQLLAQLEKDTDPNIVEVYSETEYNRIKSKMETIQRRITEINDQLIEHRKKLEDFKLRVSNLNYSKFMGTDLELIIDNIEALELVLPMLEELRDRIDLDKEAANEAIKIFQELETEEEQKITELFSKDSSAAEIFNEITNGRYSDLHYDIDSGSIIVERPTGETLEVSKLSKGTRDQLYLAIRVALGEKILEGSPGFFIMDDAFLSSDENRLDSQVEMLEKLSNIGWQIIYVTMKKEALEKISKITKNVTLTLTQLA